MTIRIRAAKYKCSLCDEKLRDDFSAESRMNIYTVNTIPSLIDLEKVEILISHGEQLTKLT